jgi:hypothetical protein
MQVVCQRTTPSRLYPRNRALRTQEPAAGVVDVAELRVPVGMLTAFPGLRVRLQAVPGRAQQPRHGLARHRMSRRRQRLGKRARRLRGPPQRRHRIPPGDRIDQRVQRCHQPGISHRRRLTTTSSTTRPIRIQTGRAVKFRHPQRHRRAGHPSNKGNHAHPTPAQLPRLSPQQGTAPPLRQLRPQHPDPTPHRLQRSRLDRHPQRIPTKPSFD